MLEDDDPSSVFWLSPGGSHPDPFDNMWPWSLPEREEQTAPDHNVWHWGWCSWGYIQHFSASKHGHLRWCLRAEQSHLTTSPSSGVTSDGPILVPSWAGGPYRHCRISSHNLICVPHGHITGLWGSEFLLVGRGIRYLFHSIKDKLIYNFMLMFSFWIFVDMLSLSVKINLPWALWTVHVLVSGKSYKQQGIK